MAKSRKPPVKTPLLDSLDPDRARTVLFLLIRDDPGIADRAEAHARALLETVDYEQVAGLLFADLESLDIEDVWETAGQQRDGSYRYPGERAYEMAEEILAPYRDELSACMERGMPEAALDYAKGLILGLWRFRTESSASILPELEDSIPDLISDICSSVEEGIGDPGRAVLLREWMEEEGIPVL